ncbi:MAG TPA: SGNH/GDSL hydrolase family protein [Ornithinimicrobium sp.]|uniref:SGNH/GDSL hydrolase family protein n=1 Tax=Ornithinimicrobium sp. TaxID=1977084 RepID=UPI002B48641B|nr:SGNH/GDSL hydrolase family protein [Ornithinimicrobium sp.]HKJ13098.1 SGNH/GDSL hydrolase family protein [Ornithinimicrobium sp.]
MSRAERARTIAARAAFGGGGLAAAGLLGVGVLRAEAELARHLIGESPGAGHEDSGTYGAGTGRAHQLLLLGDSTAAGVGADDASTTMGATVAIGVAAITGRPVHLVNLGRSGATSLDLADQVERGCEAMPEAEVAIVMIGSNDVKNRVDQTRSVRALTEATSALQGAGVRVVVGTCPDLGTIRPVPQPLRALAQRWSRDLAAAQTVAVVETGGRTVSIGDLIGPDFHELPELFSADRFHPSSAGYARAAAAMLPSVLDALGESTIDSGRSLDHRRGEAVEPLPAAAERAVDDPGSEVSGVAVDGNVRGERGRWAQLLRRHRPEVPEPFTPSGEPASD